MAQQKMICGDCEVEMNHHADKVDYTVALSDSGLIDPLFGGVVEETHTCPNCGKIEWRRGEQ